MIRIKIQYFAILREERGCEQEELETAAKTPTELFAELTTRYTFSIDQKSLSVAIGDTFGAWDHELNEGDLVTFIPPVSGG